MGSVGSVGSVGSNHTLVHTSASCGSRHGTVTTTSSLDIVAVDTWRLAIVEHARIALLLSLIVDVFEIEGVDVTREKTKQGKANIYNQVCAAARDHEHAYRGQKYSDNNEEELRDHVGCRLG